MSIIKKAVIIMITCSLLSLSIACNKEAANINDKDYNDVLVYVNGDPIFLHDIEASIERYEKNNISIGNQEALQSAISEMLVIQQADKTGLIVSDEEINELVLELEKESPLLYKIVCEDYTSIDAYKSAMKLSTKYNHMMEHVVNEYLSKNQISEDEIKKLMIKYKLIADDTRDIDETLKTYFINEYNKQRGQDYFSQWINSLHDTAQIEYTSLAESEKYI